MIQPSIEHILPRVVKPARYIGRELNVIKKDPASQRIRLCLAFPDVYEIGQSYVGFSILYHVANQRRGTLCERTFAPWPDMEEALRSEGLPLSSVESLLPLASFDVIGFTLQYELHYPAVLNMLDLGGIPLRSTDRGESDPIVIGGGPCCANPEPLADFFDAFLLGDGEEALPEMLDVIERSRAAGISRHDTLIALAGVAGVYIPSFYRAVTTPSGAFGGMEPVETAAAFPLQSRIVESLKPEYYPPKPLVPICEVVHDRLAVELMRGCTHGCRFCGAGMTYRPQRTRPVEDVLRQVVEGIEASGWEDVSLLSLSSSDYPGLGSLVRQIGRKLASRKISISLSSLRADNFSLSIAEAAAGGKKTSLTFAVEAASQRLRDVINKDLTEPQLMETLTTALEGGWSGFKLYFMVGLPTETDEDVTAIADLLNRIDRLVKQYQGRRVSVTLSPFSPKPQTPFQWERQDTVEEIRRKYRLIKSALRSRAVIVKETDPAVSLLECLLGRGGRDMGAAIHAAWRAGSRFDGWSEYFSADRWRLACAEAGIAFETAGAPSPETPLAWDHLSFGVTRAYLARERERAYHGERTPGCGEACQACGPYTPFCAAQRSADQPLLPESAAPAPVPAPPPAPDPRFGRKPKTIIRQTTLPAGVGGTRIRIKFGKNGIIRFTGHLDTIRIVDRSLRRAGIPVAFSQGFHPHPKLSFGPSLPLGMKSIAEYADITLGAECRTLESDIREAFPVGFSLIGFQGIPDHADSLSQIITLTAYQVRCTVDDTLRDRIASLLAASAIPWERETKKGAKQVDLRPGIHEIAIDDDGNGFTFLVSQAAETIVKPSEMLALLFEKGSAPDDITRIEQYAEINGTRATPFEAVETPARRVR